MVPEQLEKARLKLQEQIAAAISKAERNRLGQFSTPPILATEIVAHAVSLLPPRSKIRFLEPGFGTGPFYSALLQRVPISRLDVAAGYEIDQHYGRRAKEMWEGVGVHIHLTDFTKAETPKDEARKYNLVVCNPPYVRHHHLSQAHKRALQAAVTRHIKFKMNGLSGLYAYFLVLSQAWMKKDGIGAWLIPSEFMDVNYGRRVKEFLVKNVTLCRIHRFDPREVQFDDALVSSAVVFFTNSLPPHNHVVEFSFGGTVAKPKVSESIKLTDLGSISKWTRLPHNVTCLTDKNDGATLADLFNIKRGLATGCNSFFVLREEQAANFHLPKKLLRPILPSPRDLETDEIHADENGAPQIQSRRYLFSCNATMNQVKTQYPTLWKYLEHGIEKGVHEGYLCWHREPWYSQEDRPAHHFSALTWVEKHSKESHLSDSS